MSISDAYNGALNCWNDVKGIAADGHDVGEDKGSNWREWRITGVNPPTGTPLGRDATISLTVVPLDVTVAATQPCAMVTAQEAAAIMGVSGVETVPLGDYEGSVTQSCTYTAVTDEQVVTKFMLPGSFPIDPQTELEAVKTFGPGRPINDLGSGGVCTRSPSASYLMIILSGGRAFQAFSDSASCDQLEKFARTALSRTPG